MNSDKVLRAAEFARRCHAGQVRKGAAQEPYTVHWEEVASGAHHTLTQWLSLPDVQASLDPSDAVDEFIEMARLDARALPGATG